MNAQTWLEDANGNRCSVEYFGTRGAAQTALDSLKNCRNCINCSDCSDCSRCSDFANAHNRENVQALPPDEDGVPTRVGHPPVPIIPDIHRAIYAAASRPDALEMGSWHTCDKTHCRAGWAVALAGKEGRDLETFYNTPLAAMMIYDASDPTFRINPGRFFDDNEAAIADMKRMAEKSA